MYLLGPSLTAALLNGRFEQSVAEETLADGGPAGQLLDFIELYSQFLQLGWINR